MFDFLEFVDMVGSLIRAFYKPFKWIIRSVVWSAKGVFSVFTTLFDVLAGLFNDESPRTRNRENRSRDSQKPPNH